MVTEQDNALEALKIAIQMEIDGKEFYLKASRESTNELGKKLLESLAGEEDVHRQKFTEIYNALRDKNTWPAVDFQPNGGRRLRTIFARATEEMGSSEKAPATELEAVKTAMDMENKSYDFYINQSKNTTSAVARDFYETVSAEEREHHIILQDYYEYLQDPAAWFVKKEHPSLDAG
jgi:rubrerythrin